MAVQDAAAVEELTIIMLFKTATFSAKNTRKIFVCGLNLGSSSR